MKNNNNNNNNIKQLRGIFECKAHLSLLFLNSIFLMDPSVRCLLNKLFQTKRKNKQILLVKFVVAFVYDLANHGFEINRQEFGRLDGMGAPNSINNDYFWICHFITHTKIARHSSLTEHNNNIHLRIIRTITTTNRAAQSKCIWSTFKRTNDSDFPHGTIITKTIILFLSFIELYARCIRCSQCP